MKWIRIDKEASFTADDKTALAAARRAGLMISIMKPIESICDKGQVMMVYGSVNNGEWIGVIRFFGHEDKSDNGYCAIKCHSEGHLLKLLENFGDQYRDKSLPIVIHKLGQFAN